MISVYIAMPYGDHNTLEVRQRNTEKAMEVWHTLADAGFQPFCPHLSHFLHEHSNRPRGHWLTHTILWLEKCDCVLAVGKSEGVMMEINMARKTGKPVFFTLADLGSAYGMEV